MTKLLAAACAALLACAPATPAQDPAPPSAEAPVTVTIPIERRLDDLTRTLAAVRAHGKPARSALRLANDDRRLRRLLHPLRRELLQSEVETASASADVERDAKALGEALIALVSVGLDDAAPLARAAAAREGIEKDILERIVDLIHFDAASAEADAYVKQGIYFEGMYQHLRPRREAYLRGFSLLFQDEQSSAALRINAGEGLTQLVGADDRAATIETMQRLMSDVDVPTALRTRTMFFLARLGDRAAFDGQLAHFAGLLAAEQNKEKPDPQALLGCHARLTELYQGLLDHENTARHTLELLLLQLQGRDAGELEPTQRQGLAGQLYNLACNLSRADRVDASLWAIAQSFGLGYANFAGAAADGDLATVRRDPRFAALVTEWQKKRDEAGKEAGYGKATVPGKEAKKRWESAMDTATLRRWLATLTPRETATGATAGETPAGEKTP